MTFKLLSDSERLPPETHTLLFVAACDGSTFLLGAAANSVTLATIETTLEETIQDDFTDI